MKENSCLVYFLTQSLFLGFGISILFLQSGKDCYIGAIVGLLIGLLFIRALENIIKHKKGNNLKTILNNNKIIGPITRILIILTSYFLLIYALVIFKVFVASFLLIKTPEIFITVPITLIACYAAFKSLKVISRVAEALLPLSLILFGLSFLGILGLFETTNFLPILSNPPLNFIKSAFTFAFISIFPNILIIHFNGEPKGITKMYILSSLIIISILIYVNGVFGENLVHVFRFPEYMVLKQLKLFQFIEKSENILSMSWLFSLFFVIAMSIYSLKELSPTKKPKLITSIILILTIIFIDKVFAFNYVYELKLYYALPYIAGISSILIILLLTWLIRKKSS